MKSKLRSYINILLLFVTTLLVGCNPSIKEGASKSLVVDAGVDQQVEEHTKVTLLGNVSSNSFSPINSYAWTQTSGPSVKLIRTDLYIAHFYAPEVSEPTSLTFQLDAGDANQKSAYDYVTVIVTNVDNALSGRVSFASAIQFDVGGRPISGALADFDGNGNMDLVTINLNDAAVFTGNGDGTFNTPQIYIAGRKPTDINAIDINNDGMIDIVVTDTNSSQVLVLLANGDGTFKSPLMQSIAMQSGNLALADFNADGFADLILVQPGASPSDNTNISSYIGLGNGSFELMQRLPLGNLPKAIAVTDLNVDGIPDAVITDDYSLVDRLFIVQGLGDGTFATGAPYEVGWSPFAIATGDLNGDKFPDVVTANLDSDDVSILLGDGDGTLKPQSRIYSGGHPSSIAVADMDNDGVLDIVTANNFTSLIAIHLGIGNGTFNRAGYVVMPEKPLKVLISDLNNDDYLDVVTVNGRSENVSVLMQKSK